jgi:hypothetical protein
MRGDFSEAAKISIYESMIEMGKSEEEVSSKDLRCVDGWLILANSF